MTRISLSVLEACQVDVAEENEKCECFNWSQDLRAIHIGDQETTKVIRKLRSQSHRTRPKECAVSVKMKGWNGRMGFLLPLCLC